MNQDKSREFDHRSFDPRTSTPGGVITRHSFFQVSFQPPNELGDVERDILALASINSNLPRFRRVLLLGNTIFP